MPSLCLLRCFTSVCWSHSGQGWLKTGADQVSSGHASRLDSIALIFVPTRYLLYRAQAGCDIKMEDPQPGRPDRIITIRGSNSAIVLAEQLMKDRWA